MEQIESIFCNVSFSGQYIRENVKVLEFHSFCIFSCFLTLFIILIKPFTTKAYDRCASGDCGTSSYINCCILIYMFQQRRGAYCSEHVLRLVFQYVDWSPTLCATDNSRTLCPSNFRLGKWKVLDESLSTMSHNSAYWGNLGNRASSDDVIFTALFVNHTNKAP